MIELEKKQHRSDIAQYMKRRHIDEETLNIFNIIMAVDQEEAEGGGSGLKTDKQTLKILLISTSFVPIASLRRAYKSKQSWL